MHYYLAIIALACLTGCVTPSTEKYPAGDGVLTDTNGVPVDLEISTNGVSHV
jgi:hypothetical protein